MESIELVTSRKYSKQGQVCCIQRFATLEQSVKLFNNAFEQSYNDILTNSIDFIHKFPHVGFFSLF